MNREKEVFLVLTALTILAFVENLWFIPYAPWMPVYAALVILIPLKCRKRGELGLKRPERWKDLLKNVVLGTAISLIIIMALYAVHYAVLWSLDLVGNFQYDYLAAKTTWNKYNEQKFGVEVFSAGMALYALLWAPIGEELLYRGYAFNTLLEKQSFTTASTASSLYFGVRHASHLLAIPTTPLIPSLFWAAMTIPVGYILCYILRRTRSLYSVMSVHFLLNFLPNLPSYISLIARA
jgi:membrane protease YdiL (CAAX protease family)